jgi:hypothetical protein
VLQLYGLPLEIKNLTFGVLDHLFARAGKPLMCPGCITCTFLHFDQNNKTGFAIQSFQELRIRSSARCKVCWPTGKLLRAAQGFKM